MKSKFTSSAEVFDWLSGFINLERGQKPKSFRIDRMEALAQLAGNPHKCAPSIHIAGSKGKGSVTSMLAAMLTASGFCTARYMSPHVADIRERICIDGSFFSEEAYCRAGDELRDIVEARLHDSSLPPSAAQLFDTSAPDGCEPTYWELLTLFFFLCARYAKCDAMAVETGLGGRLDSTNILDPLVSIITLIELEHTNFLGGTIAEIAGEKAGIIKQGKPLILAEQCGEALEVFRKKAQEKNSRLYYLPEISELTDINITSRGTSFSLLFSNSSLLRTFDSTFSVAIPGRVQAQNAALTIAAMEVISKEITGESIKFQKRIDEDVIRKALANIVIPARFEKISETPPFIIDGAHTPESLSLCVETFKTLYGEGGVMIFGCAADKDVLKMAETAHSGFTKIIITTPGTFKVSDPAHVYETFVKAAGEQKVSLVKDTQEAVRQAVFLAKERKLPVLGTGSFYLVSEIRKILFQK